MSSSIVGVEPGDSLLCSKCRNRESVARDLCAPCFMSSEEFDRKAKERFGFAIRGAT